MGALILKMKNLIRNTYQKYKHLGIKRNDAFLVSYQNSGSTWLRFMLSDMIVGKKPEQINEILPFVGKHNKAKPVLNDGGRLIKTHEQFRSEYKNKRAIYIVRDPRDVEVSKYKKSLKENWNIESRKKFFGEFVKGNVMAEGRWDEHFRSWKRASEKGKAKVHFVKYEDLKKNSKKELEKIADFLGVDCSEETIQKAIDNNSVEKMKKENKNVRKGKAGNWKEELTKEEINLIENEFKSTMENLGYLK